MALPKEPRQKMINIMYLVLTALLALNVSAEIINAFVTVDNSLRNSNKVLTSSSLSVYEQLDSSLNDPKTEQKAKIWKPQADKVREYTQNVYDLIEKYKLELLRESGYNPEKGDSSFKKDDIDAATRLFDVKGKGVELYKALEKFREQILSISPEINGAFKNNLPLNLENPILSADKTPTGVKEKDWITGHFYMTPTVAALTMLSKFQNDVKNTENIVATYCLSQVGASKIIFTNFSPLISANATYLMPGDELQITAGLGAFNAKVKPQVIINGSAVPVDENGVGKKNFNVSGSGTVNVTVNYIDPNTGKTASTSASLPYTVGSPSGVAVQADKMLVLYAGVDNPLTITAGAGSEKVSATFSGGSLSKKGGSQYVARPTSLGNHTIAVFVEGKPAGKVVYRVKKLPPPTASVGGNGSGDISLTTFKAEGGVIAKYGSDDDDVLFDAKFKVVGFSIREVGSGPYSKPETVGGDAWPASFESKLKPGSVVLINNIKVVDPAGIQSTLKQSLNYVLK
ncbi:MAG: gliding motility protein GldM [Sphingobacteriales bacterium]|jgi:gliding motility-associated protein GldM